MAETFWDRIKTIENAGNRFKEILRAVFCGNVPENQNSKPANVNQESAQKIQDNFNDSLWFKKKV